MGPLSLKAKLYRLKNILKNKENVYFRRIALEKLTMGNYAADWTISSRHISKDSIFYSFGVGQEISFDLEMIRRFGVNVYAFDPSPGAINWIAKQQLPEKFKFFPFGLGSENGKVEFGFTGTSSHSSATILNNVSDVKDSFTAELKTLKSIMLELGHDHVDILKMDIEGAEYKAIENILDENLKIGQLLVEFHHRFRSVGIRPTRAIVKLLRKKGFQVFHISDSGEEVSFINLSNFKY